MGYRKTWQSELARNLMEKHKATTIEEAAKRLIDQKLSMIQDRSRLDLPVVASILGIDSKFSYVEMEQSARIVQLGTKCFIEVNKNHPKQRQRFSIGHEIAHRMLRGYKLTGVKARDNLEKSIEDQEEEDLCDLISAYLLGLSSEYMRPILQDQGLSFETMQATAKKFDVSFEAAARALMLYCEAPAAILYCVPRNNRSATIQSEFLLRRFYSSDGFPLFLQANSLMPDSIVLKRAFMADSIVKIPETLRLDGKDYRFSCEAKKMPIYLGSRPENGVVLLLMHIS